MITTTKKFTDEVYLPRFPLALGRSLYQQIIDEVVELTNTEFLNVKTQPAWIVPTLINNWSNYGSPLAIAGYMKDSLGFVHIKGFVRNGIMVDGTTLFVLPAGYRPSEQNFFVNYSNLNTDITPVNICIDASGNVIAYSNAKANICLEISFKAEQ